MIQRMTQARIFPNKKTAQTSCLYRTGILHSYSPFECEKRRRKSYIHTWRSRRKRNHEKKRGMLLGDIGAIYARWEFSPYSVSSLEKRYSGDIWEALRLAHFLVSSKAYSLSSTMTFRMCLTGWQPSTFALATVITSTAHYNLQHVDVAHGL